MITDQDLSCKVESKESMREAFQTAIMCYHKHIISRLIFMFNKEIVFS